MVWALGVILIAAFSSEDGGRWADVLRDAQLANQAFFRQGRARLHIEYAPGLPSRDRETITLEIDVTWRDDDYFEKIRLLDKAGLIFGTPSTAPLDAQPDRLYLFKEGRLYTYDPYQRIMRANKEGARPFSILQCRPQDLWFTCCPPSGADGRPWPEMIGPLPATTTGGTPGEVAFHPLPDGTVKQVRKDPDEGVAEIVFSLEAAGSPVTMTYTPAQSGGFSERGRWQWKKVGAAVALDGLEIVRSVPKQPRASLDYRLKVVEIDLKPVPASLLTRRHFQGLLPPDAKIVDDETGHTARARPPARITDSELERLEDELKSHGFLKP